MTELTDFNWTYLTIVYMIFKFYSDNIIGDISFNGRSPGYNGTEDPNCYFYKRQFETYIEFDNFRTKIISVVEKYFEQIDWNVFMNPHYYLSNNLERNNTDVQYIYYNKYFKKINKFIEENKNYINWKKITFFELEINEKGMNVNYNFKSNDKKFIPINLHVISLQLDEINKISLI